MKVIHGVAASPFVRKVLVALRIKDLPYEQVQQMPFARDPEYLKINPLGKIPTLVEGDLVLGDSTVICHYLEDTCPEPALYPVEPSQRARANWYEELGDTRVAELAAGIFFQRFMRPTFLKQETDEALVEKIVNKQLPPILDYIEGEVPDDGFLFGDFMLADLALMSPFINAGYAGYEVDDKRWPRFAAFIARVKSHPVIAGALEEEAALLGR